LSLDLKFKLLITYSQLKLVKTVIKTEIKYIYIYIFRDILHRSETKLSIRGTKPGQRTKTKTAYRKSKQMD
jgi:hypothetical protein